MFKKNNLHNQKVIEGAIKQLDGIIAQTPEFATPLSQQARRDPQWFQHERICQVTERSEISDTKKQ